MSCGLHFLEERIGHTKLQLFESAYGGEWQGDIKDTSLYLLWSSAKEIAKASVDVGPTCGGDDFLLGGGDDDPSGGGDDDPSVGGDDDPSGGGDDDLSVLTQVEEMMILQVVDMMIPQVEVMMVS